MKGDLVKYRMAFEVIKTLCDENKVKFELTYLCGKTVTDSFRKWRVRFLNNSFVDESPIEAILKAVRYYCELKGIDISEVKNKEE